MTPKQERFVDEYLIDLNATQAYIRAGYSARANSAEVNAARLLRNAQVSAAVRAAMNERALRVTLTADKVLEDIERVRLSAEKNGQYGAALRASELQGKHLKLFDRAAETPATDLLKEMAACISPTLGPPSLRPSPRQLRINKPR